jgi:hypothetical protein
LLALLLVSSGAAAAPAPLPKPQRTGQRPATQVRKVVYYSIEDPRGRQFRAIRWALFVRPAPPPPAPTQPPNADPPG